MNSTRQETTTGPFAAADLPNTPEARRLANGWHELAKVLDLLPAAEVEARSAICDRMAEYATRLQALAEERRTYLRTPQAPIRGRIA